MQKYAHLNRGVKNGAIHTPIKKKWVSHIQFPWKRGAYRIPGSAKKGAIWTPPQGCEKWGHSYTNQEKMGQSYTVSLEKGGLLYTWQR